VNNHYQGRDLTEETLHGLLVGEVFNHRLVYSIL